MNKQLIYEWLRPILAGKNLEFHGSEAWFDDGDKGMKRVPLPLLDWNTFHNEVIPKLKAEGFTYLVLDYEMKDNAYICALHRFLGEDISPHNLFLEQYALNDITLDMAYTLLTDYLTHTHYKEPDTILEEYKGTVHRTSSICKEPDTVLEEFIEDVIMEDDL